MAFSFFHKIWFLDCDDFRNLSSWEYEEVETSQTISVLELIVMALWGAMGFNKYLHHTHTCSNLSSRDASKEQRPAKKSSICWTAMQIIAQWYRYRPTLGTPAINPFWPEISEKTTQDGWAWILTMRKGKEVLGLVREGPQGFAARSGAMQGSPRCSVEVEEPLAGPVESAGPGRSGEVVLYTVHRPCPSLVDIRHHLENGCPGVAEGNMQPVSSVGKKGRQGEREKMHLRAWVQERWSAAKSTVFRGKQRNVLWGSLPPLKKTQQILKAKENQIFLLCLETTAAYYKGLIQGPRLTSEDFESGARMA